jgi:hypothetical protein
MKAIKRIDHYDSIEDYMAQCLANPDKKGASHDPKHDKWAGGTLENALKLHREGWEGRPDVSKLAKDLDVQGSADLTEMTTEHSTQGSYVDVPAFLEGVPECMVEFTEQPAPKVVRIGFSLSTGAHLSEKAFANRGAVLLALYNKVASAGYSIEIVCYAPIKQFNHKHSMSFVLKRSDQYMDEDELAFWCCHPSALRRIDFMHRESLPEADRKLFGYHEMGNYGIPIDLSEFKKAEDQLALDCRSDFRSDSFDEAVEYYNKTIEGLNAKLAS